MRLKLSILNKILFPSLVIPLIAFTILTIYSVNFSARNLREIRVSYASSMALNVMDKIDRNYYERFGDVQAFAYNPTTLEAINDPSKTQILTDFMNTMASYYVLYDLLLVVDVKGDVVAFNTKDKAGNNINSADLLLNRNFANEEWFLNAQAGPEGGAWYSGFTINKEVAGIDNDNPKGYGVGFSAPIYDKLGNFKGVWYNFSSWKEITQKIRQEATLLLKESYPEAEIIITDNENRIIDADDNSKIDSVEFLNIKNEKVGHVIQSYIGKGAYTYKGNNWKSLVIIKYSNTFFDILERHAVLILICIVSLVLTCLVIYYLTKSISRKLLIIKDAISSLSEGDLKEIDINGETEIEEMKSSINYLADKLKEKSVFAEKIGQGDLLTDFIPSSEKDILGKSLLSMRDNLFVNAEEDKKRNWINFGLNKLSEVLRISNNLGVLTDNVLRALIQYTNSLQGAIYVETDEAENQKLKMVACYAYERKKNLNVLINKGEGLIGQAFLENKPTYLTEIPESLTISSGTGFARPKCMLIVPLTVNDETHGILQLASFQGLEQYQIDFVQKIAESLAISIKNSKVNERTNRLLDESLQQSELMKSQEEELRQNMEELAATQEEMKRKAETAERNASAYTNSVLKGLSSNMATIEFTPDGHILDANENFLKVFKYSLEEIKEQHHKIFVPEEIASTKEYQVFWKKRANGENENGIFKRIDKQGNYVWLNGIYTSVIDGNGKVIKVIKFATEIAAFQKQLSEVQKIIPSN